MPKVSILFGPIEQLEKTLEGALAKGYDIQFGQYAGVDEGGKALGFYTLRKHEPEDDEPKKVVERRFIGMPGLIK